MSKRVATSDNDLLARITCRYSSIEPLEKECRDNGDTKEAEYYHAYLSGLKFAIDLMSRKNNRLHANNRTGFNQTL